MRPLSMMKQIYIKCITIESANKFVRVLFVENPLKYLWQLKIIVSTLSDTMIGLM